jgi:DNA helicase-2/ATP-dependent DNA helicase PcrA
MKTVDSLNKQQQEAASHKDGPLLIIAGAGAGKTKTLTHRIINLIRSGVSPQNILAITFTNKAAGEMKERVFKMLSEDLYGDYAKPWIGTFHSLGVKILRDNAETLNLSKNFTIADDGDSLGAIKEAIKEIGLDPKQYEPRRFKNMISRQKGNFVSYEDFEKIAGEYLEKLMLKIWKKYEENLRKEKSLDFDDLLLKSTLLLKKNPEVRKMYQDLFRYIHIDEYQDTNQVQYELARLITGESKNICVVGDSDQNIYSWRGANIKNILNFEKDYSGATTVLLEENYRSTGTILEAANEIIRKNLERRDKNLFTRQGQGEQISLYEAMDESDEAEHIASKILELKDSGKKFEDMAVLYRTNFQSRVLEEALLLFNIPYQVLGTRFFDRKEIRDVLSYLKASLNPEGLADIKRIINEPARGIGKTTVLKLFAGRREELPAKMQAKIISFYNLLEEIKNYSAENKVSDTIKFIVKATGLEKMLKEGTDEDRERLENIKELATLAKKYDELGSSDGINKFLEEMALMGDQDTLKNEKVGVRLMTVHASKGLEFPYVFIAGLEQDLFPHAKDDAATPEEAEEERRLFYVALTRACRKIYLSWAETRMIFGSRQINSPSEFISDIPDNLLDHEPRQYLNLRTIYM